MPIEYATQILVTFLALVNFNWVLVAFSLPLSVYHGRLLATKGYKQYAITRQEYKSTAKTISTVLKYKLAYYVLLLVLALIYVLVNSGNMVWYNLFGATLFDSKTI